jgi:hypothetical protein
MEDDARGHRRLELGDGRKQAAQQLDLDTDKGGQGGRRDADRGGRAERSRASSAAGGLPPR